MALHSRYSRIRFRHLRLLDALHRTGSIGQSAEELGITQSAATKVLQDAEDIFGAELFDRSPRGMVPTATGRALIAYARRFLNDTEQVVQSVETLKAGGSGSLAIGAIMGAMPGILPVAMARLRARRPLLSMHLTVTTSDEILELLAQRKLEVGVCRLTHPTQTLAFDCSELFDETLWVFVGGDHPLARASGITLADLAPLPWVLQPPASPARQVVDAAFAEAGVEPPRALVETTSRFAALNLVLYAGMIGLLPSTILAEPARRGEIVRLRIALPHERLTRFGLVTARADPLSESVLDFMAIVRSLAGAQARSPATGW